VGRWARFRHWLRFGTGYTLPSCPVCGSPVSLGPTPSYGGKFGVISVPRTPAELRAGCTTCHPDREAG
jgi:hypothetical protein